MLRLHVGSGRFRYIGVEGLTAHLAPRQPRPACHGELQEGHRLGLADLELLCQHLTDDAVMEKGD